MKTTVDNNHKNTVINYLFFGIAASIFTLSIFFSVYQQEEQVSFYNDLSFVANSTMQKPMTITETHPVDLKAMLTEASEAPLAIEPWMTESFTEAPKASVPSTATYTEAELLVEPWMTNMDSWALASNYDAYSEAEMAIESWMLNMDEWFVVSELSPYITNTTVEAPLEIETWMLSLDSWSTTFNDTEFSEPALAIEDWMLNPTDWLASNK